MCTEDKAGEGRSAGNSSLLAITSLVYTNYGDVGRKSTSSTQRQEHPVSSAESTNIPSIACKNETCHLQTVRRSLQTSGISEKAINIISCSWRSGTRKQYGTYIAQWKSFCNKKQISANEPSVGEVLDFLVELFDRGLGYSAINTARCALSTFISIGNYTIGAHPLVIRFLKGVFNQRPTRARHTHIWDVSIVLNALKKMSPANYLSLKELSFKLATLMALISAQRVQTLFMLDIAHMKVHRSSYEFILTDVQKHTRPGHGTQTIEFKAYAPNRKLCIYTYIKEYLNRTKMLRKTNKFFISYQKPYKAISKETLARWIKTSLHKAGIDKNFTAHSTRSAATSAAAETLPIDTILKAADWATDKVFAKYYHKPVVKEKEFAKELLQKAS